jgi:SAM-dependent methyltransferase
LSKPSKWDGQRESLDDLSGAVHYNEWIYRMLKPYLGKRILEIGCGTGNLTGYLGRHGRVLSVDLHEGYLRSARARWGSHKNIRFQKVDLTRDLKALKKFRPDTILCVNVLEHLPNDRVVLARALRLLPPGGQLLLFVPAFQFLFGSMDRTYGHYRRYSLPELRSKMEGVGFRVVYGRYLNLLGVPGWWINGKVFRRKIIPKYQLLLYDKVLILSSLIERFLPKPIGLSVFGVGQRPSDPKER